MKIKVNKDLHPSALTCEHTTRIRFNECDSLGIVWHGHYLKYFEDGREAFGRQYGISYLDVENHGFFTPITQSILEHQAPLKYGDVATIKTTFLQTRAAKLIFEYEIKNQNDQLVCTGQTTQVFMDKDHKLSILAPPFFKNWKAQHNLQ